MALYNPKDDVDYQKALAKLKHAREQGNYIDLTEKEEQTLSQNNYLHLCLAYFGDYFGYSAQYTKEHYFKAMVNPDIFVIQRRDRFGNEYKDLRHSNELTKEEMSQAIDNWVTWCAETADCPMPDPDDYKVCMWLRKQLERKHKY